MIEDRKMIWAVLDKDRNLICVRTTEEDANEAALLGPPDLDPLRDGGPYSKAKFVEVKPLHGGAYSSDVLKRLLVRSHAQHNGDYSAVVSMLDLDNLLMAIESCTCFQSREKRVSFTREELQRVLEMSDFDREYELDRLFSEGEKKKTFHLSRTTIA